MDLAEQVDPEEWHKIMDRFFAILSEGFTASRGRSINSPAMGSWRYSARRSPTKITHSARWLRGRSVGPAEVAKKLGP
jgi:hypothetical protein